jgi:AcrR family transcriptional regulator
MTKIRNQDQVVDVAARIFGERGYENTRLEDIAAELGVLQGSLYYHIDSKAALYRLVRVRRFTGITDEIDRISKNGDPAGSRLKAAWIAHLSSMVAHQPEAPNWFRGPDSSGRTDDEMVEDRALTARYRAAWRRIVEDGIKDGEFRTDLDPTMTVLSLLGVLNFVSQWYRPDGGRSIESIVDEQLSFVSGGLLA